MPLCPQITITPITVTTTGMTQSSVIAAGDPATTEQLSSVEVLIDGKTKVYRSATEPTGAGINDGDLWIDTANGNKLYVRTSGAWVSAQDASIGTAQTTANNAATAAGNAQSTANTALANAATAFTTAQNSLQPSAYAIQNPTTKQLTSIDATGLTVYSGASATTGARVVLNSAGLAGFNAGGTATFSISASTGAAVFSGSVTGATITASTMNIGGNAIIDATGLLTATGATITGTINATAGYFGTVSNGFSISSVGLTGVGTGAITGGKIQTSSGTSAVILDGSTTSMYFKYLGTVYGHILPATSGSVMIHYGATADPVGNSYPQFYVGSSAITIAQSTTRYAIVDGSGLDVGGTITATGSIATVDGSFTVNSSGAITAVASISATGLITTTGAMTASGVVTAQNGVTVSGAPIYTGTVTTSPTNSTEGIALTQGGTIIGRRSNDTPLILHIYSVTAGTGTSVPIMQFYRNATARGTLEVYGNTVAPVLVGSSDYRLKENIREYNGALDKLMATKVRVFNEIEDENKSDIVGFVAHEFAEIFPNFVGGEKDAIDENGNPIYQKLGYGNLVPHLVKAIQELKTEINQLKGE